MLRYTLPAALFLMSAGAAYADCREEVARFQKLIDGDLKTGFLGKAIYAQANADLAEASTLCKSGQDAAATSAVIATRKRHGYPAGSNQNLPK